MSNYRDQLLQLYTTYRPDLISHVDILLEKFKGREEELLRRCRDRYAHDKCRVPKEMRDLGDLIDELLETCSEDCLTKAKRSKAIEVLERAFKAWTGDETSRCLVYGSVAYDAHLPNSDTDILCITASHMTCSDFISDFGNFLLQYREQDNHNHQRPPYCTESDILLIPTAMPPLIQVRIFDIEHDVLFTKVVGSPLPPPHLFNVLDPSYLVGMNDISRRSLGGPILVQTIINILNKAGIQFVVFCRALKAVKLWAVRRGIHGAKYGYPGGAAWVALTCAAARRCLPGSSALHIIETFFKLHSGTGLCYPVCITQVPDNWRKSPGDAMAVLVPAPAPEMAPKIVINTCNTVTKCTLMSLVTELNRAAALFSIHVEGEDRKNRLKSIWNSSDFFSSFQSFLQIEIRAASLSGLSPWLSFISSRVRDLLVLVDIWMQNSDSCSSETSTIRLYPFLFRTDKPLSLLDVLPPNLMQARRACVAPAAPGDFAGYIYLGLSTQNTRLPKDGGDTFQKEEADDLIKSLEEWVDTCNAWFGKTEEMFTPTMSVIDSSSLPDFVRIAGKNKREGNVSPEPKATSDLLRAFKAGVQGDHLPLVVKKVIPEAGVYLSWMPSVPSDENDPHLLKDTAVAIKAVDGDGESAWVVTEHGAEGFVSQKDLADYLLIDNIKDQMDNFPLTQVINTPLGSTDQYSPLTPSTAIMRTIGDSRLRTHPIEESTWVDKGLVLDGTFIAVRAIDEQGEYALVRFKKYDGFIKTKHLAAIKDGGWINSTRSAALRQVIELAKITGKPKKLGILTPMETSYVNSFASTSGIVVDTFADQSFCFRHPETHRDFPMSPVSNCEDVLYSGITLDQESINSVIQYYKKLNLDIPPRVDSDQLVAVVKIGSLHDALTEGQIVHPQVVAFGKTPNGIAFGLTGCKTHTVLPTPHVIIGYKGTSDDLPVLQGRISWELLPEDEIFSITGELQQYVSDGICQHWSDEYLDESDRHYSFE